MTKNECFGRRAGARLDTTRQTFTTSMASAPTKRRAWTGVVVGPTMVARRHRRVARAWCGVKSRSCCAPSEPIGWRKLSARSVLTLAEQLHHRTSTSVLGAISTTRSACPRQESYEASLESRPLDEVKPTRSRLCHISLTRVPSAPHPQRSSTMPPPLSSAVPASITRPHLVSLYAAYLRASSRFASYNFRSYFLRRSREKFRTELPAFLTGLSASSSTAGQLSTAEKGSALDKRLANARGGPPEEAGLEQVDPKKLREWYLEARRELGVLERAAVMNRMYEAPKLVVEGAGKVMTTGGGGAGMEQACVSLRSQTCALFSLVAEAVLRSDGRTGGAGQPDAPEDTISTPMPPADPHKVGGSA